ncbi:MAG: aldose 1-epimerase family protein [Atopobiaceae bacterium]|jgi:galactose mutarotase-like enzyme|nr:aldose 1-epimerase family protein [Atopobiaceae bacterium]MCI2173094.1 aldose 1-epimerase family protein [Atopobiaceae bacterium]MCI2208187.1 aldose 1-epimerase family protein [Atopobiaceae bacterium]
MSTTTISNGTMQATFDHMGAQMVSLMHDGHEYLWQGDERWWPRHAPVLFPIVGAIRDGKAITQAGETHMKSHGVARNYEHTVVASTADSVTFELSSTPETKAEFPYDFKLNMTYTLIAPDTLEQSFVVTNTGDVVLPFIEGGHPAFNVPAGGIDPTEDFDDYEVRFAAPWSSTSPSLTSDHLLDLSKRIPVTDDTDVLPITHRTFDIDTLMLTDCPGSTIELVGPSGHGIREDFGGFRYLGIWSAAGDASFVALEPWTGYSTSTDEDDVFEHKASMTFLTPGARDTRAFTITLF